MSEDEDFAALFQQSVSQGKTRNKTVQAGQVIQATVVQIGRDSVFVDVGTRSEGEIDRRELEDATGKLTVKVGDRIQATVAQAGDRPKLVMRFGADTGLSGLEVALEAGTPVEGTVSKAVKGGLEVQLGKLRAFCPASQVDINYTPDISIYEGQTLRFKVVEIREGGRSIVVSRKALMADERMQAGRDRLQSLTPGQIVEGTVRTIQSYGAFIDLGGVEGLVHISELGHGRVSRVEDVLSVGEQVQVKVLSIEENPTPNQPPRISLSLKQAQQAPAPSDKPGAAAAGPTIVDAEVVKVESFGVFVETATGSGVVPTRELDLPPGGDPRRVYPVGKQVRVVAIGTDEKGRPRYSMRRVEDAEARANYQQFRTNQGEGRRKEDVGSLGELLKSKLKG